MPALSAIVQQTERRRVKHIVSAQRAAADKTVIMWCSAAIESKNFSFCFFLHDILHPKSC